MESWRFGFKFPPAEKEIEGRSPISKVSSVDAVLLGKNEATPPPLAVLWKFSFSFPLLFLQVPRPFHFKSNEIFQSNTIWWSSSILCRWGEISSLKKKK